MISIESFEGALPIGKAPTLDSATISCGSAPQSSFVAITALLLLKSVSRGSPRVPLATPTTARTAPIARAFQKLCDRHHRHAHRASAQAWEHRDCPVRAGACASPVPALSETTNPAGPGAGYSRSTCPTPRPHRVGVKNIEMQNIHWFVPARSFLL